MIRQAVSALAIAALASGAVALGLIASGRPATMTSADEGLDFTGVLRAGPAMPDPVSVPMRDGYDLQVRDFANDTGPLVVLVHGSGWNGFQFNALARDLQVNAHVIVPDLRGHGADPGRRGDVDYIGQLGDDLADLITATKRTGQKVVLIGHSSGGGLVVRFAGGAQGGMVDRAVLLAPFLKYNAPTTRPNAGGWARPWTRRIIGLSMLNAVGITALNHLTVMSFTMPKMVLEGSLGHLATTSYSYRLNTSYAPRAAYLQDIAALPPFLVIAGAADEAFFAQGYAPLMSGVTDKGRYVVVPEVGHLDIVDAPETLSYIQEVLDGF